METVFKNDASEGNKTILQLSRVLCVPYKSRIISQIIFQQVYPKFFKKENHNTVAFVSVYLASKINETLIKLEAILEVIPKITQTDVMPSREKLIAIECKIIELVEFQFNIRPAQFFLIRIGKTLSIDVLKRLAVLDDVHGDGRVNFIKYFNGMYESELVALSVLNDDEIDLFECFFSVGVDRAMVNEIRSTLLKR